MSRILPLLAILAPLSVWAQLKPPVQHTRPITDPSMIVMDRGVQVEVLASERAAVRMDALGRAIVHHVIHTHPDTPISPLHRGVVFNHAMQQQGYITGEIAFQTKDGQPFRPGDGLYPGLKKLGSTALYEVSARTPLEFVELMKRLQAREDVQNVEPVIIYGPTDPPTGNQSTNPAR